MITLSACTCGVSHSQSNLYKDMDSEFSSFFGDLKDLLIHISSVSPFLKALLIKEKNWLETKIEEDLTFVFEEIIDFCSVSPSEKLFVNLRVARRRAILIIALADFGGLWSLDEVTSALTRFAEIVLQIGLDHLVFQAFRRKATKTFLLEKSRVPKTINRSAHSVGLVGLAMGKMGANELIYSSDIDLIFFFDESLYHPENYSEVRKIFIKVIQNLINLLSSSSQDGFVFRVDLRLRPDPGSNPICIGLSVAERYYESFGRSWERAAFIKARAVAGNIKKGNLFLKVLSPFIWRKNVDFSTLLDTNKVRIQARSSGVLSKVNDVLGYNLKTGRGGIRDIEFFTQAQQLVLGGRNEVLRSAATVPALKSLCDCNWMPKHIGMKLISSYKKLRQIEHRIQLIDDTQTHSIPQDPEKNMYLAALCFEKDIDTFLNRVFFILKNVEELTNNLFNKREYFVENEKWLSDVANHKLVKSYLEKWHTYSVFRSERSLELFAGVKPMLLDRVFLTESPSETLFQFDKIICELSGGVQLFSLFRENPNIVYLLIDICGSAPGLAEYLSKNISVLDFVVNREFYEPLFGKKILKNELIVQLKKMNVYEDKLDECRRWVKEHQFRTSVHLLVGISTVKEVALSYSNIAEACLECLFPIVHQNFALRYGYIINSKVSVIAMGKLGSREMSFDSDLDLILIYDSGLEEFSTGSKIIPAKLYFSRLTQSLISALTVSTSEGSLFKVDMRLRPSGRSGPVATSFRGFKDYQICEAWVWETLALSKSRVLAGDKDFRKILRTCVLAILRRSISHNKIVSEIKEMRKRLFENQKVLTDVLDLKIGLGSLQDLELLIQFGCLMTKEFTFQSPYMMIRFLKKNGFFSESEARMIKKAYLLYFSIQQIAKITAGTTGKKGTHGIWRILKLHDKFNSIEDVVQKLKFNSKRIDQIFEKKLKYPFYKDN